VRELRDIGAHVDQTLLGFHDAGCRHDRHRLAALEGVS
jgi:hypothetical protein